MTRIERADGRNAGGERSWVVGATGLALLGVALVALGAVGFGSLFVAGFATMTVYGGLLIAAGVAQIVIGIVWLRSERSVAPLLSGILSSLVGVFLVTHPMASLASFTLLLGLFFVALGLFLAITSAVERRPGWWVDLAYGALTTAIGAYVLATWPASTRWLVGALVSVELVARGLASLGAAFALRRARGGAARPAGARTA